MTADPMHVTSEPDQLGFSRFWPGVRSDVKSNSELELILQKRGYRVIDKIGEGNTRDVYVVEYQQGLIKTKRVLKVPKSVFDSNSATTVINWRGGRDLNQREIAASNNLSHPNIVQILDTFEFEGKTMTVEDYYDSTSLEELIRWSPLADDPRRFGSIFGQVLSALKYLHCEKKILHRDIKPNNILASTRNSSSMPHLKLTDFQNATSMGSVEDSLAQTRGGTAYSYPDLLNCLMEGKPTKSGVRTEFYSLGATMFFALTGSHLFDRELVVGEGGTRIKAGDKYIDIVLREDGKIIDGIGTAEHELAIKKRLKEVPRAYRPLLKFCLSLENDPDQYVNPKIAHELLDGHFKKATNSTSWKLAKKFGHQVKMWGAATGVIMGIIVGGHFMNLTNEYAQRLEPTVERMLFGGNFLESQSYFFQNEEKYEMADLQPYYAEIKENIGWLEKEYEQYGDAVQLDVRMRKFSVRMTQAMLMSIMLTPKEEIKTEYGKKRFDISLVPYVFSMRFQRRYGVGSASPNLHLGQKIGFGMNYLKQCLGTNGSVADVYACYFADDEDPVLDIFHARAKANNHSFYTTKNGPGYGSFLSTTKKDLIMRAIALYSITDETGVVHTELLGDNNMPMSGLVDK
ncbi:protein kinase [Candidatus Woesearchaeota archaeon]|jgi:serine/threonine protein kinase|nr:protein kinase [Candidatus Woesearchaeota archaeon]